MTSEEDWLARRRQHVTASDVARAHTGSYGGLYGVVAEKLGRTTNDIDPQLADRGHRWEQPIADAVRALTGLYIHGEQMMVVHPNGRDSATLDGLVDPRPEIAGIDDAAGTLETKTKGVGARANWPYYTAQMAWQHHVAGKAWGILAVAEIDDIDDRCTRLVPTIVERDDFLIGQLLEVAETIWQHMQAGTLPDPDEHTDLSQVKAVNAIDAGPWIGGNGKPVEVVDRDVPELEGDLARYLTVCDALKPLEHERELLEARFRHTAGSDLVLSAGGYLLRVGEAIPKFTSDAEADALALHPEYGTVVLDRSRFKAERPDDYAALKRPTTDRRITVKEIS